MLKRLYIKNFTLIDELDIAFYPGFSVVTGETGAGKSIIVGAVGLLLGSRADVKSIKAGREKCVIEAHFDIATYNMEALFAENDVDYDANECIIRRELNANGKSRAFINDTPVSLATMKQIGEQLLDVHSQHQNLLLNKEDFQLGIVDIIAHSETQLQQYRQTFSHYRQAVQRLDALKEAIARNQANEDFMRFQWNELTAAQLKAGELADIEQEVELLSHAEDIKSALYQADRALSDEETGVCSQLRTAQKRIEDICHVYPELSDLSARLSSCAIELNDIAQEVSDKTERVEFDPQKLDVLNARLDTLYALQQKYHVATDAELLDIQHQLERQLAQIDNSDEELQQLQTEVDRLLAECQAQAQALTRLRSKAIERVEAEMLDKLVPLGMPNARFKVEIVSKPLANDGADKVTFLFSANKSTTLQPVHQVASGGEIARVMLSLKALVSGAVQLPTIIFDEIDTGVSGSVAEKMAQIMFEMGAHHRQVISITHLPQIAAIGSTHYKVTKQETEAGTVSRMTQLDNEQRIEELAKMLSGSSITQAAIDNAKALLNLSD